jgi:UDP-N-acetylmuramoylalanine--D-glutamate ligase
MQVPKDVLEEQLSAFTGLSHRQNVVSIIGGVPYVNDSKATNAQAASMALRSYDNIYWILGGQSKEGGLTGLEDYVGRVQHAFLIGAAQHEFAIWLEDRGVAYTLCEKMETAVEKAHSLAQSRRGAPGGSGVVLLSPACASFDQFESYEQRGDVFSALVKALAKEAA